MTKESQKSAQSSHKTDCVYVISQPSGTYVKLDLVSIDISCHDAGSDYLEIKDGGSDNSPLMGAFCGDDKIVPAFGGRLEAKEA